MRHSVVPETGFDQYKSTSQNLTAETVQGAALTLQRVYNIKGSHGLPASVLRICDSIADDVLQENLQHRTSLFINQARDTFHTTTTSETSNGRLRNTLDVIARNLPVPFGAALAEPFAAFTTTCLVCEPC